jgi:hypothetical protein
LNLTNFIFFNEKLIYYKFRIGKSFFFFFAKNNNYLKNFQRKSIMCLIKLFLIENQLKFIKFYLFYKYIYKEKKNRKLIFFFFYKYFIRIKLIYFIRKSINQFKK